MATVEGMPMSQEDFDQLCKLRTHARESEDRYIRAAENAKQAKRNMEASQDRVNKFLDEMADGPLPLEQQAERNRESSGADPSGLLADAHAGPDGEPGTVPVSEEPGTFDVLAEDERWKSVPIDEIAKYGIKPSLIKKLRDAGIGTIGDLANFTTEDRRLTDIPGIGQTSNDEIVDAMIGYFEANPMPKPQVVAPETAANEGESSEDPVETPGMTPEPFVNDTPVDSPPERTGTVEGQAEALEEEHPKQPKQPRRSRKQSPGLPLGENETSP